MLTGGPELQWSLGRAYRYVEKMCNIVSLFFIFFCNFTPSKFS